MIPWPCTKWIKQLDDGRITRHSEHNGTGDLPYVKEIYAALFNSSLDPPEVLPIWIWETLQGPSLQYQEFQQAVRNIDDWGLYTEVLQYCELDESILYYKAKLDTTYTQLAAAQST